MLSRITSPFPIDSMINNIKNAARYCINLFAGAKPASEEKAQEQTTDVHLTETIVRYPKKNHLYRITNKELLTGETRITFTGDMLEKTVSFDLTTANKKTLDSFNCVKLEKNWLVAAETLHFDKTPKHSPPALYSYINEELIMISRLDIVVNKNNTSWSTNGYLKPYKSDNLLIQSEIKQIAPKIPVAVGSYPIFLRENRPSHAFLESLYANFLAYNDESRLDFQYKNELNKCHIRAHFVSVLLASYGIQSVKIIKYWNPIDWITFSLLELWRKRDWSAMSAVELWSFHCVAMVRDNENKFWAWDPWVGRNKKLLTPEEWLFPSDEPTPRSIKVTNSICNIGGDGGEYPLSNIMHNAYGEDLRTLQAALSSGVPNPPERPIIDTSLQQRQMFFYIGKRKREALAIEDSTEKTSKRHRV